MDAVKGVVLGLNDLLRDFRCVVRCYDRLDWLGIDTQAIYNNANMCDWVRDRALPYLVGQGLDIGCGRKKVVDGCIGVDDGSEFGGECVADHIGDVCDLGAFRDVDWVFSSHCLEHIERWEDALREWVRVLRVGGVLFVYLPNPFVYPAWSKEYEKRHVNDFSPRTIVDKFEELGLEVLEYDDVCDRYASFRVIGRKKA